MRILVIEDEQRIAGAIKRGLEMEKYVVDVAYDGVSGYDMAAGEEYDLIILDLMLPGMDGVQICKKLREKRIHTPILMLTAKGLVSDRVIGLDSGADDYLTKPFAFEELVARVRALARRPKQAVEMVLSSGNLTLDPQKFEVKRGDVEIQLSSKEFALLEFLMRHPKQILSKEQIINHVWSYDADVLPNTVEVTIKNLRTKIDGKFSKEKPVIKTVRGFGYKLEEG